MIEPSALAFFSAIVPLVAVVSQTIQTICLPTQPRGTSFAKMAAVASLLCGVVAVARAQFFSTEATFGAATDVQIGHSISITFFDDRLTLFWLVLNSLVVCQLLWQQSKGACRTTVGLWLVLLSAMQAVVLVNNAQFQWTLLSLTNWLFYSVQIRAHSHSESEKYSMQPIIFLTVADMFWMLGLLGVYLITGTLEITLLTRESSYLNLSDSATALLITSVMSLFVSLVIRFGFFPMMTWTNHCIISRTSLALLWVCPISLSGYLLFRWLPVLSQFGEALTLTIGLAALSAVLLAVSAMFRARRIQLQRLGSVLIAFAVIGVAKNFELWPQMAALMAGAIVLMVTLSQSRSTSTAAGDRLTLIAIVVVLLCGTSGLEPVLRSMAFSSSDPAIKTPPVMLPLLVLTLGVFLFGLFQHFQEEAADLDDATADLDVNRLWGLFTLVALQAVPFFLSPQTEYELVLPIWVASIVVTSLLISNYVLSLGKLTTQELNSLVKLCREDYYVGKVIDRGLTTPIRIGALFIHLIDNFLIRGLLVRLPRLLINEAHNASHEQQTLQTPIAQTRLIIFTLAILLLSIWWGLSST